jgi:hypothetical protein
METAVILISAWVLINISVATFYILRIPQNLSELPRARSKPVRTTLGEPPEDGRPAPTRPVAALGARFRFSAARILSARRGRNRLNRLLALSAVPDSTTASSRRR